MLQEMRTAVSSPWIKMLLAALVLSFITFYGWRGGQALSPGVVASVNGETISSRDYQNRYQNMVELYRRRGILQSDASDQIWKIIQESVLASMIHQKLKVKEARKMGLVVSPEQIREAIQKEFSDSGGKFDFERYRSILARVFGKTPGEYEKEQAAYVLEGLYDNFLLQTAFSSTEELKRLFEMRNDKVSLTFVRLDPEKIQNKLPSIPRPSEAQLKSYYDAHAASYLVPEARKLEVSWYDLTDFEQPTASELSSLLRKRFPQEKDPAATGERVRAAHILLRLSPGNEADQKRRTDAIYARLKKGADFARVARAESEDPSRSEGGDLGYFGRGMMVKEFEAKAFALKPGEISQPFKTPFGYHILKVLDKIPAGPRNVERLKPELILEWKKDFFRKPSRQEKFFKEAERLFTQLKTSIGSSTLETATKDPRTHYVRTDFVSAGDVLNDLPDPSDSSEVLRAAQTVAQGALSAPIRAAATGHVYLVRVDSIKPARVPPLEDVRQKVSQDFMRNQRQESLKSYSKELLSKWIRARKPMAELAKREGFTVEETGDFSRAPDHQIPKLGPSEAVMKEVFSKNDQQPFFSEPQNLGGQMVLIALQKRTPPDWTLFEQEKERIRSATEEDLGRERLAAWVGFLRANAKIKQTLSFESESAPPDLPLDD